MAFLLFWQFSNKIVGTDQAKRFYPMINLLGSFGNFVSGTVIKYISTIQNQNLKGLTLDFNPNTREIFHEVWIETR